MEILNRSTPRHFGCRWQRCERITWSLLESLNKIRHISRYTYFSSVHFLPPSAFGVAGFFYLVKFGSLHNVADNPPTAARSYIFCWNQRPPVCAPFGKILGDLDFGETQAFHKVACAQGEVMQKLQNFSISE